MHDTYAARADELARTRTPFVQATVVRAEHPTSAHAGDTALVHADGEIEGFVGGTCAENAVRLHALQVLASGEALLLRIEGGAADTRVEEGAVTVANPCLSGGSLEIFLQPRRPTPVLLVAGDTPVARALAAMAVPLGLAVAAAEQGSAYDDAAAVVVASHGRGEEAVLEAALRAGVPYVALVASRVRAAAVLASLDADDEQRQRVHSPAGLDLRGHTAPEIALSILAELVATGAAVPRQAAAPESPSDLPVEGRDPVCGMTVAITSSTPRATHGGTTTWFCSEHCRESFVADPERYADSQ